MAVILAPENLRVFAEDIYRKKVRLVLTNGCFDLLHLGHVRCLKYARSLGDFLFVAVNSDTSATTLKGIERPINSQEDRVEVLAALRCVDYISIFDSLRVTQVIRKIRPVIYVKGGDYTLETLDPEESAALTEVGAEIRFLPQVVGYSTTALISRLQ